MLEQQADMMIDEVRYLREQLKDSTTTSVPGSRPDTRHDVNLAAGLVLVAQALERIGGALERLADVADRAAREMDT
jgi:phosphate uptake regulator